MFNILEDAFQEFKGNGKTKDEIKFVDNSVFF